MSSHVMAVRANLKLKKGVTLPKVWGAIAAFVTRHDIKLQDGWVIPTFGEMPLEGFDNEMSLGSASRELHMNLMCYSMQGCEPDELSSLCEGLDALVQESGYVEIVDMDTSAANDDAVSVRFLGADEATRIKARIEYGLGLAKDWLVDVLGPSDFEAVRQHVHQLSAKRLSAR